MEEIKTSIYGLEPENRINRGAKDHTILYVDDEAHNLRVFKSSFRRHYNVITTTNTFEALEEIKNGGIDVLVTDQKMPELTGTELIKTIRDDFPDLISIIITGYSDIDTVTDAVNNCNIFRYVTKPYDVEDLKVTFDKALEIQVLKSEKENLLIHLNEANLGLEKRVKERTSELDLLNQRLQQSIDYAQRIQSAVIGFPDSFEDIFSESMTLYKPLHTVSGDFYYMRRIADSVLIGAFDCTGHGVPGALLSILGVSALDNVVSSGIIEPAHVMMELNNKLFQQLRSAEETAHDGMDGSIVLIDKQNDELVFSGSRSEITFFENGELKRLRGSKKGLGESLWSKGELENAVRIPLGPITEFYLYSDGFRDQLNEGGRRIMTSGFQKLLQATRTKTLSEQKVGLAEFFDHWKGKEDQTDDVMVLGFRF